MRKYDTDEERLEAKRAAWKRSYYKNKEKKLEAQRLKHQTPEWKKWKQEYDKKYRESHREKIRAYDNSRWNKDELSRAKRLIQNYIKEDKAHDRGECTLTPEYMTEMFKEGCYYCGEKDFTKLGADRIDNLKAHTVENCVCSCSLCNVEKGRIPYKIFKFIKLHPEINPCELEVQVPSQLQ